MRYIPEYEAYEMYSSMLDDIYGEVNICGLNYSASIALQRVDETAYRCGFNDWCDSECITTDWCESDVICERCNNPIDSPDCECKEGA